eukprot:TRINITY_DN87605_c0_g1_i1.p1 TRINITY_DN87605_c0_g1~~TRINITY_DN87605_c0_g1_i1.p1  ORF type:complete len:278 (-),score=48.73 TRINITY_DN87605_c0_g1_i1:117-881(-)
MAGSRSLSCLLVLAAITASMGENLRSKGQLRGALDLAKNTGGLHMGPCHCEIDSGSWTRPTRTKPRCVFIDLGAGTGKDVHAWANNTYGPISGCPNGGDWEAILVEANPLFKAQLEAVSKQYSSKVTAKVATAAYMCEAKASFYLDTKDYKANALPGQELNKVEVQTLNINRLLTESTIPGDWVLMKMDVEGAEFDIVPCMAQAPAASLVDRLYVEEHNPSWGLEGATQASMQTAMAGLRTRGIDIPAFTPESL